jgi:hypothetical protein
MGSGKWFLANRMDVRKIAEHQQGDQGKAH